MECIVKHFSQLTADELFLIYKLRVSVFVVEQNCPYQEVDDFDREAYHVFFRDEEGLQAYLRVLPGGTVFPEVSIGAGHRRPAPLRHRFQAAGRRDPDGKGKAARQNHPHRGPDLRQALL